MDSNEYAEPRASYGAGAAGTQLVVDARAAGAAEAVGAIALRAPVLVVTLAAAATAAARALG